MSLDEKKEQVELSGNTLLVYLYVLKKGHNCGVREVQRMLGFSSSSTAHYHLEKLTCKGILTKDQHGNYKVNEKVKVGRISAFIFLRGFVFPTQLIYAIITTLMCISFLGFFSRFLTPTVILALSPGIVASAIFWHDTIRLWQSLPSFKGSVR